MSERRDGGPRHGPHNVSNVRGLTKGQERSAASSLGGPGPVRPVRPFP